MNTSYWTFDNDVRIRINGSRLLTNTPYRQSFVDIAPDMGGKFRRRTRSWSFPIKSYSDVIKEVNRCYGVSIPLDLQALLQTAKGRYTDYKMHAANDRGDE